MHTTTTTMQTADLYLMGCRLRADIAMLAFTRLSDVLNNIPGIFLHATLHGPGELSSAADVPDGGPPREVVVRLHDVLFVRPLGDSASGPRVSSSAERRERLQQPMVLQLEGWRITGSLHLVDYVRWVDFATASNTRFIVVTDATVAPAGGGESIVYPLLFVNGARLSALYEVD